MEPDIAARVQAGPPNKPGSVVLHPAAADNNAFMTGLATIRELASVLLDVLD